jgi:hypothetical protein
MYAIRSVLILSAVLVSACGREASDTATAGPSQTGSAAKAGDAPSTALPILIVHKNESCGCCSLWVEHMKRAGFAAEIRNVDNMEPIKRSVGIPAGMGSCHTAQVGRYFIEGHVPAEDVLRLFAEQPDAKGLTVPRMPVGSPGMEVPSGEVQPYDVYLVANDGMTSVYAHHKGTTR